MNPIETFDIVDGIRKLVDGVHLTRSEARAVMDQIMDGAASPAQISSFITALRMKGETVEEVTGFAMAMRQRVTPIPVVRQGLLDTCGTGGDGGKTFNISTAAAIVAAAGGVPVAKHGNRAVSGKSGSADVLEVLGIRTQLVPEQVAQCLSETGFAFFFAPIFHPAMKHAVGPRREIRIRTVFNLLGPLTNPASAETQIVGVYDVQLLNTVPEVLANLGVRRAMVVASEDGLDEVSVSAPTYVAELRDGRIRRYIIEPEQLGLQRHPLASIAGGTPEHNARIIEDVFQGATGGPRDIVLANAGAALYIAGKADHWQEGIALASQLLDTGAAWEKLQQIRRVTEALTHDSR
ncbi:MAG: anthranilate phosphoribosyltransferase [Bacillaceae bacterium G1]|nr:anthranilate phosphoribosyltransferase [Bacillota bacterium]OJF18125.1 MAG: anthranilate phosphoribosyltransferase [Bacillaceae bacterium G1]